MKINLEKQIHNILKEKGDIQNTELVKILDCPRTTFNRAISKLSEQNLIIKHHGWIEIANIEHLESVKMNKNVEAKRKIGLKLESYIEEGDVIFVDAGSTTTIAFENISISNIIIFTNSMMLAKKISSRVKYLYLLGGRVNPQTEAIIGSNVIKELSNLQFTKCFLGIDGYDENNLYTSNDDELIIKKAVAHKSEKVYILADSSKNGKKANLKFKINKQIGVIDEK